LRAHPLWRPRPSRCMSRAHRRARHAHEVAHELSAKNGLPEARSAMWSTSARTEGWGPSCFCYQPDGLRIVERRECNRLGASSVVKRTLVFGPERDQYQRTAPRNNREEIQPAATHWSVDPVSVLDHVTAGLGRAARPS
jgi:hypothetical protein